MDQLLRAFNNYSLNMEDSPEVNDLKKRYLITAKEIVQSYLGYSLDIHQVEEEHIFTGSYDIYLREFPVLEVYDVILADGKPLLPQYYTLRGDHIRIHTGHRNEYLNDFSLWKEDEILIEYAAGYRIIPDIVVQTILRIASLLQTESNGNIGLQSKSYGNDGSRSFMNFTSFQKYLDPLYPLRVVRYV